MRVFVLVTQFASSEQVSVVSLFELFLKFFNFIFILKASVSEQTAPLAFQLHMKRIKVACCGWFTFFSTWTVIGKKRIGSQATLLLSPRRQLTGSVKILD